ncbi:MAG: FG-GAP-like repeat-containing protein [Nannocystaceae bacterium]
MFYDDGLVGWMEHYLVGNVDGAPAFFGPVIQHAGSCGGGVVGLAPGHLDGDGFVDLAEIGACEVRNYDGAFAFAAEWGDGTGAFEPVGVPFTATSPTAWLGVADFDDDGFDDVVIAFEDGLSGGYEAYVEVHRSRGDRTFDPPTKVWTDESEPGGYPDEGFPSNASFILGDVDGDGGDDFIFKFFMVALVDVLGDQQTLEMFDVAWKHNEVEVVSAFDLNHDERLDFIVDGPGRGRVRARLVVAVRAEARCKQGGTVRSTSSR